MKLPTKQNKSIEEFNEVEPSGTQTLIQRASGDFHEVEIPAPTGRLATRCEYVNLDIYQQDGTMYLVLTDKDPERSMKRLLDTCDAGLIVDILETWTFQYRKPVAIYTDGGALFGGLFKAWCGYHSIEHRIRLWPQISRSGKEWQRTLVPGNR